MAERIYVDGLRRFPICMMALLRAEYCFCYKNEISSALHILAKAESYGPTFDESFSIFALRMTFAVLDDANQRDITAYLLWQNFLNAAALEDEKASSFQFRFWTELATSSPV